MIFKNVEKNENNSVTFVVESDAAEFEKAVNGAYLPKQAPVSLRQ